MACAARTGSSRRWVVLDAVDVIDRKIIDQLRIDGRRSFAQIGRYVGLSEAAVRHRYQRLVSLGIVRVVGLSRAQAVGEVHAHLTLRVRKTTVDDVAKALVPLEEVRYVSACVGSSDIVAEVRCASAAELAEFLTETIRRIPGIDSIRSATLIDVVKDSYLWDGFRQGS